MLEEENLRGGGGGGGYTLDTGHRSHHTLVTDTLTAFRSEEASMLVTESADGMEPR